MKILNLEVKNVRGIKDITLNPQGKTFVVWGLNGTGKSAVVDAVDFLLTGRISRLMGQGTANITLQKHGPHVDCTDPKKAYVRASILINGESQPIDITRSIDKPGTLVYPIEKTNVLKPVLEVAKRGQYVLTRREILRFITAEGGKRAQDIQALLNLSEVENFRQVLVQVSNKLERQLLQAKGKINNATGLTNAITQSGEYDEETVLVSVNKNRSLLYGQPLSKLQSSLLKKDIKPPAILASSHKINTTVFENDISNLLAVFSEDSQKNCKANDIALRSIVLALHEDESLLKSYKSLQLTSQGLDLLDGSGNCPLCDTSWEPEELKSYLLEKLKNAKDVEDCINQIEELSSYLDIRATSILSSLNNVLETTKYISLKEEETELSAWKKVLENFKKVLANPIAEYHNPAFTTDEVGKLFAINSLQQLFKSILQIVKEKFPESTPEQTAWDFLNRLESPLKSLEEAEQEYSDTKLCYRRAVLLKNEFINARDVVLEDLYSDIKNRFVDLYRELHNSDEGSFDASLKQQEASLDLEVDFYGRGNHPPHALHSEGHQDSMGLCLFMALSEKLTENLIDLVVLDDVVMSVDAEHRRELCRLLSKHFPNRQFLITTHDRVWANQLRSEGVVSSGESIEFFDWNIATGPKTNEAVEIWAKIEKDLECNDVNAASARLRHGSEHFFAEVCDNLHASVEYRLSGKYELGDFIFAAMCKFKELLKTAKSATQSWVDDKDEKEKIQILDEERKEIYRKLGGEQWAVNVNVHYNEWANFGPNDFKPVVDVHKNLFDLFVCKRCGGILRLVLVGKDPQNVRCNCGAVNWNLVKKKGG